MRYELSDHEWGVVGLMLSNKPRGIPRVDDRRVLMALGPSIKCAVARPAGNFGLYTTCYNRFVRWRKAGVWDQIMNALTAAHDVACK